MESRASRLLRGTLLGSLATLLAALSHTWAGGHVPGLLALLLGAAFASAVGTIAIGPRRRTSLLRTSVGVGIGQLAFHLVFSLIGTGGSVALGSGHHATATITVLPTDAVDESGAAMWLAHALAGVATITYLRRLEALVWSLLARVGGFVLRALEVQALPATALRIRISAAAPAARGVAAPSTISRRGPPAILLAA